MIAQAMVKLILHLRIGDNDARRPDAEQHVQAVLAVTPEPRIDDPCLCRGRVGTRRSSWPTGATSRVPGEELRGPREDAGLNELEHVEVDRRRYQLLRRFMDQYSEWFRGRGTTPAHRADHRSRRVMAEDRRRVGRHWVRGAANEICCVRWISLMLITISSTCLTSCTRGLKVANPR